MLLEVIQLLGIFLTIFVYSSEPPDNHYVEYIPGNTNLIFSVPHDGSINLTSIPVRQKGCKDSQGVCTYPLNDDCDPEKICKVDIVADLNAKEIARTVYNNYVKSTGKYPHLIMSHLHRSMLDPNRPVGQAAQGNTEAIAAYEAFHGSIKHAHAALEGKIGLHIDFHGYTDIYRQNSTMVSYFFNSEELNTGNTDIKKSSIQALVTRTGLPVQQFLYGDKSLGSMIESDGYKAVPSPRQPSPGKDKYYKGGWILEIHGSRDGGVIDAIMLEFPTEIRLEATAEERHTFGMKLAKNIERFQSLFYNLVK